MSEISLIHPGRLAAYELAAWRDMQRRSRALAHPFLTPEFALAVSAVRPQTRVAVLHQGSEPAGFMAFERGRLGLGRALAPGVSDVQGLVHRPGLTVDPVGLLARCRLAVLDFDHLLAGQFPGAVSRLEPSPVIDLPAGAEPYLEARARASRTFRRAGTKMQALRRDFGRVSFEWHSPAPDAFAALVRWKSAQYRRTGRIDRFAKPWIRELVQGLMSTETDAFAGRLAVLRVDGRPVAVQAALAAHGVLALWFPAYDPDFARYSPGVALRLEIIKAASEHGIARIDMGKGHSQHKELLKTGETMVAEARVECPGARALLHRLYQEPPRRVERFVLDRPRLRVAARHTLARLGGLRSAEAAGRL